MWGMNIDDVAKMTEQELFAELGLQITPSAGFGGDDLVFLAGKGRAWFREHANQLRERICGKVKATGDLLVDASAVAAALSDVLHETSVVLVISILVVRQGLAAFCRGHEN
jgi:hypothetical protein